MKNALPLNRDTQERRGNGCSILAAAFILGVEQRFQFVLQIAGAAIFFGGFERIHRWSVVRPEFMEEFGGRPAKTISFPWAPLRLQIARRRCSRSPMS